MALKPNQDEDIDLSDLSEITKEVASKLAKYGGNLWLSEEVEGMIENVKDPIVSIEKIDSKYPPLPPGLILSMKELAIAIRLILSILDHCFTIVRSEGGSVKTLISIKGQDLVEACNAENNFLRMFAEAVSDGLTDDSILGLSGERLSVVLGNSLSSLDFDQQEECLLEFGKNYLWIL